MRKIITSLFMVSMFSAGSFAQTANNSLLKSSLKSAQQNIVNDLDDDGTISYTLKTANALKPTLSDAKKVEIPANIKQGYEEDKDDGYLLEGFQLGVGIGVLGGANAHLGYRIPRRDYNFWKNRFGFRIDYNSWKPLKSTIESYLEDNPIELDDNKFKGMISGTNYGALIDFYPFGNTWFLGNFRISGGYYTGDFAMDAYMTRTATSEEFEMSGFKYKANGEATLNAAVDADVKGPYAGLGFDFQILLGLKLYFDAGVVFIDNPKVRTDINGQGTLTVTEPAILGGHTHTVSVDAKTDENIRRLLEDTKKEYEDELDIITDSKIFPMVKVGLMLRF